MNVLAFLADRPCLEELDGFLEGLRWQRENPDLLDRPPEDDERDPETLRKVRDYKKALLAGRVVPVPSRIPRGYEYQTKRKPKRTSRRPPPALHLS